MDKPRPSEEDEHRRTRDYIQNIIGQQKWMMEQITDHFREVKDLMNSPGLASRVVVDCLWSTLNALADALQYADPMYNRQELLDSLHDLKEKQIPKLDYALTRN